ncbi:carbon storage regulator [Pseudomonas sp. PDM20]|uniref:carbon storage regulator n=1 Tax=Pseudomonas sp. PDM20 TaxID=2769254 RepID=UPI00177F6F21|nr:carbon storage regulator [Pseudomonas sp. PDM20]MBD9686629.1 carbon storage regulator [Pseudomonas sp. PDM20]
MGNLLLSRNIFEAIHLFVDPECSDEELIRQLRSQKLVIRIGRVQDQQVRLVITAPPCIRVLREELLPDDAHQ